jgi:hypothetical protein
MAIKKLIIRISFFRKMIEHVFISLMKNKQINSLNSETLFYPNRFVKLGTDQFSEIKKSHHHSCTPFRTIPYQFQSHQHCLELYRYSF